MSHRIDRRQLLTLAGAGGVGLAATIAGVSAAPVMADPKHHLDPFTLGVASGDPLPDGVVLWTRLAPEPLVPDGLGGMSRHVVPVRWEVAQDERFRHVVKQGVERATPALGHAVHAEVHGLRPDREYFYRFRTGNSTSPVGRTRTAPAASARPRELAFAFVSCSNYPTGYFTPYRHLAAESLDLVVHLGDYIYEGPAAGTLGRAHLPATEIFSLADYRVRHAQYKTDTDLQLAHARFPWAVTWDDHEVENNYADERSEDAAQDPESFLRRRAAAYQAYYEHMPLRRSAVPHGPDMRIYRRLRYDRLAEFNLLDGRQYRDDQTTDPVELDDPARSMLGADQERWLIDGLSHSAGTWNIVAQQTVMAKAGSSSPGPGRAAAERQLERLRAGPPAPLRRRGQAPRGEPGRDHRRRALQHGRGPQTQLRRPGIAYGRRRVPRHLGDLGRRRRPDGHPRHRVAGLEPAHEVLRRPPRLRPVHGGQPHLAQRLPRRAAGVHSGRRCIDDRQLRGRGGSSRRTCRDRVRNVRGASPVRDGAPRAASRWVRAR
ncbi:hypothetical protein Ais01nite_03750 [Asanoa ishikariensis]|uniref:Phosphodiesterase/alkaline phosphatase D n=1 Tax=Asanoa ishikariensis TaxID=137265 RepID=A0A1H3TK05_9ACTN|nr:alkaline phosphatase D family protein [Asanoa ishikariensis]GIF62340.1 hypothetical protein Ais01nite_03750 [Asanoa ishikariensis]SDZ50198.1 Phosphodiesterase/alkaline phosphatase D [Asanoa ishikariensis]